MKARIALGVITAALVTATPAAADVTIGSSLPTPGAPDTTCGSSCTVVSTAIPGRPLTLTDAGVATPGVITRWRVRTGAQTTPVRLEVVHRTGVGAEAVRVAQSEFVSPPHDSTAIFTTRLPIAVSDFVALGVQGGVGSFFAPTAAATIDAWLPALSTTSRAPDILGQSNVELLVNADVEPDADADGYGDETQDNCVGLANAPQTDTDHDGAGDACDSDDDGDGVPDASDDCDTVVGPAPKGCPLPPSPPNRAPTVRFRAPLAGTAIGTSFPIVLDVADDRGSPTVSVFDDDGTICVLRRAPYTCTWTPTGADVGRATLLASAVDSAGLSTLGIVRVRVSRFSARLTLRQSHRRRVTRVTGRLVLPAVVTRAQGCSGTVKVRLRRARRTATLTRRCTYSAKLPFRAGRAKVRFSGNAVIAPT